MHRLAAGLVFFSVATFATPGWADRPQRAAVAHDCRALANSPLDEPDWYARECQPRLAPQQPPLTAPESAGDLAYQYNLRTFAPVVNPSTLQSFPLPTASGSTVLGPQTRKLFATDFDDVRKILYAIDNNTYTLGTLDKVTGAFTALGALTGVPVGSVITGLSIDPRTFVAYMSSTDTTASTLSKIDLTTRAVTPIGDIGFEQVIDIAINCKGEIYGHDIVQDLLVKIDPATGAGVSIGPTGFDSNFAQGMDFDNSDGTLYAWLYQSGGVTRFVKLDLATGAATVLATPAAGEYEGAIPNCCYDAKGNFNRDKSPDLIFRNPVSNASLVWLMNGINRISSSSVTPNPADANWRLTAADDFGTAGSPAAGPDGNSDLVFLHQTTRQVEFWMMNGTARVGAAVPLTGTAPLSSDWDLSASGDFNFDGRSDLVWRNHVTQKIVTWLMSGTQKAGERIPTPDQAADANWQIVAALDYNHDGNRDFLFYNTSSGKIVLWWLDPNMVRTQGFFTTPDSAGNANWKVVAGGDYSASTQTQCCVADIVWRNDTSGNLVIWHMDTAGSRLTGEFTNPVNNGGAAWVVAGPK